MVGKAVQSGTPGRGVVAAPSPPNPLHPTPPPPLKAEQRASLVRLVAPSLCPRSSCPVYQRPPALFHVIM